MMMFGKPKNKWGWVRVISLAVFAGIIAWLILALVLRSIGKVSWLMGSGYLSFSLFNGVELAVIPILASILSGVLEEHEYQTKIDLVNHQETERALARMHEEKLERVRKAIQAELMDGKDAISGESQVRIIEVVRTELENLDGKGKGAMLLFLYEKRLINGEKPIIDLRNMDFSGTILKNAHINEINLENVDLSKANLIGSHLGKGRLSGTNLKKAVLRRTDMRKAVLTGSNLDGAKLIDADLEGAILRNATMRGTFFMNANIKNCLWDDFPQNETVPQKGMEPRENILKVLEQSCLIDATILDGQKITNENGKEYLRKKEFSELVDKL